MMMMKRLISLSLGVLLCLILTNCGSDNDNEKESTDPNIEFKIDLSAFTTSGTIFEAALIGKDYIENENVSGVFDITIMDYNTISGYPYRLIRDYTFEGKERYRKWLEWEVYTNDLVKTVSVIGNTCSFENTSPFILPTSFKLGDQAFLGNPDKCDYEIDELRISYSTEAVNKKDRIKIVVRTEIFKEDKGYTNYSLEKFIINDKGKLYGTEYFYFEIDENNQEKPIYELKTLY